METDSLSTFVSNINRLSAHVEMLDTTIATKIREEEEYSVSSDLYTKCGELFKIWLEDALNDNVNSIADLVTNGLSFVIDDQDIKFQIRQEPRNGKIAMDFIMSESGIEGDPLDSFGGGAVLVSSLILRVAIMSRLNMGNLLIMDEPLNALAKKYVPNCGNFIRQLCEKTGINILMVTHDTEILNYAHRSYLVTSVPAQGTDGKPAKKIEISLHDQASQ